MRSGREVSPSRADVAAVWHALINGEVTREEVHAWTVPWVEGDVTAQDLMTDSALLYLHGFDLTHPLDNPTSMRHGGPGVYVHSEAWISESFRRWRANCSQYDADPVGWVQGRREMARAVEAERRANPRAL